MSTYKNQRGVSAQSLAVVSELMLDPARSTERRRHRVKIPSVRQARCSSHCCMRCAGVVLAKVSRRSVSVAAWALRWRWKHVSVSNEILRRRRHARHGEQYLGFCSGCRLRPRRRMAYTLGRCANRRLYDPLAGWTMRHRRQGRSGYERAADPRDVRFFPAAHCMLRTCWLIRRSASDHGAS